MKNILVLKTLIFSLFLILFLAKNACALEEVLIDGNTLKFSLEDNNTNLSINGKFFKRFEDCFFGEDVYIKNIHKLSTGSYIAPLILFGEINLIYYDGKDFLYFELSTEQNGKKLPVLSTITMFF